MTIDMSQFFQVFFDETAEHLSNMESMLLAIDPATASADDLNAVFRAAHSMKGGAGTFGFTDMTDVTHVLETLLDRVRKNEMALTGEMVDAFLQAGDVVKMQLEAHRGGAELADKAPAVEICARLKQLTEGGGAPAVAPPVAASAQTVAQPADDDGFGFFDEAPGVPQASADTGYGFFTELPAPARDAAPDAAADLPRSPGRRATDDPAVAVAASGRRPGDKVAVSAQAEQSSIRVSVEKVDTLINLVGELVITQAMLAQNASGLDPVLYEKLLNGMAQFERNTRDLQESVMSIRMMPISFVFSRYPRVVRDLAGKLNKQVELKTEGEGTELDKGVIEKLADPLTHLVRNSLDHGVESPEVREAAGKPAKGTITLKAFHRGGNIMVEVIDDGAGLSRERLLAKARERGMNVSDTMSDLEVFQLIFEAGFSTAAQVTDVSGRGVGMDVVRRNIREMGGNVEISSKLGEGTRISIRLPLTLAILDGMSVGVGSEVFIIPLTYITESLQPAPDHIKTIAGQGCVVQVRGEFLPVVALHEVFNVKPKVSEFHKGIMVMLESEGTKTALFVDELLGQHQVVIKSLESNYRRVQGVSGATIMGDGRVALILDVAGLVVATPHEYAKAA